MSRRFVLYADLNAQCDKLATAVGRTKFTTLATIDLPWRNFLKFKNSEKFVFWDTVILFHHDVG